MISILLSCLSVLLFFGIIFKILSEKGDEFWNTRPKYPELLGHTLPEVIAGAVVGIVVAVIVNLLV